DTGTRGHAEELRTEADQTPRRDDEAETRTALAVVVHLLHFRLALAQLLDHATGVLLVSVDNQRVQGFLHLAIYHLGDDLGPRNRQREALTTHGFAQHRQVQLTTTTALAPLACCARVP